MHLQDLHVHSLQIQCIVFAAGLLKYVNLILDKEMLHFSYCGLLPYDAMQSGRW